MPTTLIKAAQNQKLKKTGGLAMLVKLKIGAKVIKQHTCGCCM